MTVSGVCFGRTKKMYQEKLLTSVKYIFGQFLYVSCLNFV